MSLRRPKVKDWHPEDIKALIRKRGSSIADLARRIGMSPNALGHALVRPYRRGENIIAHFLNVDPQIIWPSRYEADGSRKCPQPAENYERQARFAGADAA